jgi:hypothetical protein
MKINRNIPYKGHRIPSTRTLLLKACIGSLRDNAGGRGTTLGEACVAELGAARLGDVGFPQRLQNWAASSSCMPQCWQYKAALPDRYNDRYNDRCDYIEYLPGWTCEGSFRV